MRAFHLNRWRSFQPEYLIRTKRINRRSRKILADLRCPFVKWWPLENSNFARSIGKNWNKTHVLYAGGKVEEKRRDQVFAYHWPTVYGSLSSVITGVTGNRYESSPIPVQCPPVRGLSHFRLIIKIARKRIHAVINQYRVERDYLAFLLPRRPSTDGLGRCLSRGWFIQGGCIYSFKKRESIVAIFDKDFQGDFFFTMKESFVKERERERHAGCATPR